MKYTSVAHNLGIDPARRAGYRPAGTTAPSAPHVVAGQERAGVGTRGPAHPRRAGAGGALVPAARPGGGELRRRRGPHLDIAHRYLNFDFLADELDTIATKGLVAIALALLPKDLAPEFLTRLPNALLGVLSIWAIAELGKSLFGREAGLLAAALAACSTTFIGYQRIAREDVLVGLMLLVVLRAFVEAMNAAAERRAG